MILRRGKAKKSAVTFNRDIAPGDTGVKKAGLAHPNLRNGAAGVKAKAGETRQSEGRGKKRSKKRD